MLRSIRIHEVLVQQGTPAIGASCAIASLTPGSLVALIVLLTGSVLLVAHVFVFNDWSGIEGDLADSDRAAHAFAAEGICRNDVGLLAIALLLTSLLLFSLLGLSAAVLGSVVALLGAIYSAPVPHLKGIPVASSIVHFLGGSAHFLLGYCVFTSIDQRGMAISAFFGLVFAAGHIIHEARGVQGDALNGIRTNAVFFGKKPVFVASAILFTAAYAWLFTLAVTDVLPRMLAFTALLYPLHLYASVKALRNSLTLPALRRFQTFYRWIYAIIGACMLVALWAAR